MRILIPFFHLLEEQKIVSLVEQADVDSTMFRALSDAVLRALSHERKGTGGPYD
jgi:hypothetical protein